MLPAEAPLDFVVDFTFFFLVVEGIEIAIPLATDVREEHSIALTDKSVEVVEMVAVDFKKMPLAMERAVAIVSSSLNCTSRYSILSKNTRPMNLHGSPF